MLLDRTGTIVHANGKLSTMVGRPIEELIGANVSELAWETEDGSGLFSWQRSLKNETQVCGEVIRAEPKLDDIHIHGEFRSDFREQRELSWRDGQF